MECRHASRKGSGRIDTTGPDLLSTVYVKEKPPTLPKPPEAPSNSSATSRPHVLPGDLPAAIRHLNDKELEELHEAVTAERQRRGKKPLVPHNVPSKRPVEAVARIPAGLVADVATVEDATRTIARAFETWGRVDVLINNAGAGAIMPLAETTSERMTQIFSVNVFGPSLLAAAALPHLEATRAPSGKRPRPDCPTTRRARRHLST